MNRIVVSGAFKRVSHQAFRSLSRAQEVLSSYTGFLEAFVKSLGSIEKALLPFFITHILPMIVLWSEAEGPTAFRAVAFPTVFFLYQNPMGWR